MGGGCHITKVNVSARSNALMARISAVYGAQETVNILSYGCTHFPSESEFCSLADSWWAHEGFPEQETDVLGQYFHPFVFIKWSNSEDPSHECFGPLILSSESNWMSATDEPPEPKTYQSHQRCANGKARRSTATCLCGGKVTFWKQEGLGIEIIYVQVWWPPTLQ